MSWSIFKYPIPMYLDGVAVVEMPHNAQILCVQMQHGRPCVWATVPPNREMVKRTFRWYPTGYEETDFGRWGTYVGTVQNADGNLVFHLFVDPE